MPSFRKMLGFKSGSNKQKTQSQSSNVQHKSRKAITNSEDHDHAQVVFKSNEGKKAAPSEIQRDLYMFPKPEERETMADYIRDHKEGDVFPYISITGREEETKDNRLSRLRSFISPYNKSIKPEMRINGLVLDELSGSMDLQDLRSHVNDQHLTKQKKKENKGFKELQDHVFTKPYLQIKKITAEFVPLLSTTADYTDLMFTLTDDRLLEHQVVVQSTKIPTNSIGIVEMTCDYCIPVKDIIMMSFQYDLARPIMKEGFQWGAVSLCISVCESDTPYVTSKVEAMAVIKAPYTNLEKHEVDLDHKDVTYTAGQIAELRNLYMEDAIVDNDEPRKERLKSSSYAKSSMKSAPKAIAGPSHLGDIEGWGQLKGMRKPLLAEGVASVDAESDDESVDPVSLQISKDQWKEKQEAMRKELFKPEESESDDTEEISQPIISKQKRLAQGNEISKSKIASVSSFNDSDDSAPIERIRSRSVNFAVQDV